MLRSSLFQLPLATRRAKNSKAINRTCLDQAICIGRFDCFFFRLMKGGEKLCSYLGCPRTPFAFAFSLVYVFVLSMHVWIFSFFPGTFTSTQTIVIATLWLVRCCGRADLVLRPCFHGRLSFVFSACLRWEGYRSWRKM